MSPAQRQAATSLLKNQPTLGNRRIARLVGKGIGELAVRSLRKSLNIPANPQRKGKL